MVCEITAGGIDDIANLIIKCHDVFPMDFGDATFTSFEGNNDWVKFFEQFPAVSPLNPSRNDKWFLAKLHSHHNMGAFHSPTDTTDLYENAPKLPFFLSLVVNYACRPFAEIAVQAISQEYVVTKSNWKLKNWKLGKRDNKVEKKHVASTFVIPCDVTYEEASWFVTQLNSIKNSVKEVATTQYMSSDTYKPQNNKLKSTPAYIKGLNNFTSLFTLGLEENKDLIPYQALTQIDQQVSVSGAEDYKKAFKQYFCTEWFDYVFGLTSTTTELEAIAAIEAFVTFHKEKWICKLILKTLDELKEEYKQLREV